MFRPIIRRTLPALLILLCGTASAAGTTNAITVDGAWIRQAPPGMRMLAGYMDVHNNADTQRQVVAASSPAFGHIELHRSVIRNGIAEMIPQKQIPVPAHGTLHFAPGGYHLMLMMPKQTFKLGQQVPLTLKFADGRTVTAEAVVKSGM